jgi:hypothetical protein
MNCRVAKKTAQCASAILSVRSLIVVIRDGYFDFSRRLFPGFRQGVKVVAAFFHESFAYEPLNRIEDGDARIRVVASGFKQLVQIERLFSPVLEHSKDFLRQRIHQKLFKAEG